MNSTNCPQLEPQYELQLRLHLRHLEALSQMSHTQLFTLLPISSGICVSLVSLLARFMLHKFNTDNRKDYLFLALLSAGRCVHVDVDDNDDDDDSVTHASSFPQS